jgi:hypothetical protein
VIWFDTEIDPTGIEFLEIGEPEVKQTASKTRIEITATVRF